MTHPAEPTTPAGRPGEIVRKFVGQMKAQPGRSAATGVLLCVLLVLVVRAVVRPKTAAADVSRALVPTASTPGVTAPPQSFEALEALLKIPMPAILSRSKPAELPVLRRDIFAVDMRRLQQRPDPSTAIDVTEEQAQPDPAALRAEQLRQMARGFRLEGTVSGSAGGAFLDGTFVREGDQYQGWRVVRVGPQTVLLACENVQMELRMPEQ